MKVISIVILFFLSLSTSVHAGHFYTGMDLSSWIEKDLNGSVPSYQAGAGLGYVVGVIDTLNGSAFCPPDIKVKQAEQIVLNYLKNHPESWHKSAAVLVETALFEVWPCTK